MIQVIKYKCCGNIFAACCEPDCYTDKDWLKNLKKYVDRGDKVEMIEAGSGLKIQKCDCIKQKKTDEYQNVVPSLFDDGVTLLDDL